MSETFRRARYMVMSARGLRIAGYRSPIPSHHPKYDGRAMHARCLDRAAAELRRELTEADDTL